MMKLPTMKACILPAVALLALAVSGWAANSPVFVTAARNSFANHSALNAGTVLNSRSVLRTLSDGSATLRVGDGQVNLGHRTQLSVQNGTLALSRGYVHVDGAVAVRQARYAITPAAAQTEYEVVALTSGVTYLHVIRGHVHLTGSGYPVTVAAGNAVKFQQQGSGTAGQSGSADGAGAAGTPAAAATTGLGISAVTVGIVAAAALATGLIVHAATTPSSPSQP